MKHYFIIGFVLVTLLLAKVENVYGQYWNKVLLPNPNIYFQIIPYFLNENIGFAFNTNGVQSNLVRSIDGGKNWMFVPFFDKQQITLQQFYFTTINRGYAATSDGVYETEDTGSTWRKINTGNHLPFNSVYAFGDKVFAYGGSNRRFFRNGPLIMTSNDGKTWDTVIPPKTSPNLIPYVFGNKDSIVFAENIDSANNSLIVFSTNNGRNWSSRKMDFLDQTRTMGLFSLPHCKDVLRTFIDYQDTIYNDMYFIVHSSDFGQHWDTIDKPLVIGAWIAGNNCAQYVSPANQLPIGGLYRSTDHASHWQFNDGPQNFQEIDDDDFHNLSVVGGGAVVFAGDMGSRLWKTSDGGDGTLSSASLKSNISIDHDVIQAMIICDTSDLTVTFQNLSCNYTSLTNIGIDGLDSAQYTSVWKHHLACSGLKDSVLIKIFSIPSGTSFYTFHAHFVNDEFQIIDTSFNFTLSPAPIPIEEFYLRPSSIIAKPGDVIEVTLFTNSSQNLADLSSFDLTYSVNTDLLTPLEFIPIKGATADQVKTTQTTATVTLHFDPGFTFSGEIELGKLRCTVFVTDTLETDIHLISAAYSSGCLVTSVDSNTIHFTLSECGGTILSQYLHTGKVLDIISIRPNPAQDELEIDLQSAMKQDASIEIRNALGAKVYSGVKNLTSGSNSIYLDTKGLAAGMYLVRVGGASQSLVISR
jgi:hypothetical protein